MYFRNCSTLEELKATYRQLALANHPDKGGSVAAMQAINQAYEIAFRRIKATEGTTTEAEINDEWEMESVFVEKVQAVIGLEGVVVELVGRWLWLTGNTYPVKDVIKTAGFFWAGKKKAWFWRPDEDRSRNRKELTLEQIRARHGSRVIKGGAFALSS